MCFYNPPGYGLDAAGSRKLSDWVIISTIFSQGDFYTKKNLKSNYRNRELAVEDNQAGHGKKSWAHVSVYIGALLYWSFWKKNKKDIINVQHLCAAFIFWDIFGTPSKAFNWNVKQLYNIFLYFFYPIFNISSYFKLGYMKYRLSKINLL